MITRAQKLLESQSFNSVLDRLIFAFGAVALSTSLVLATASLFVA